MSLTPIQWEQVESLFGDALSLRPDQRRRHLEIGTSDRAVRAEVEALLAAADGAGDFLSGPARVVATLEQSPTLPVGTRLGPWRVVRLVGRGGMGEVYEAERADGQFQQRAALKLLSQATAPLLDRFHVERQILARLDHPGPARLLDGGVTLAGQPYAVMEFIEGLSLTAHCRARGATLEERLRLFLQVCAAVNDAHRNLVVHGDLKPGNTLVDASGRVRLLDFGIARLLDAADAAPGAAAPAAGPFTPGYAAPEQLAGEPITPATDVHALGLLLFELLTGQRSGARLEGRRASAPAPGRPVLLASQAAAAAREAPVPPRRLRGDLDAILARCLREEPRERYPDVAALALDLERSLRDEPVTARGAGRLYVLGRLVRRHRAAAWAGAAALSLAAVLVATPRRGDSRPEELAAGLYRTSNPQVYSEYVLGHRFLQRESQDGMRRAVGAFERALRLDPDYAPALAGLSLSLVLDTMFGWTGAGWGAQGQRALDAAERAVSIAPDLAEAHAARGKARSWIAWDWEGGLADLELAVRLQPGDPLVLQQYSNALASLGRLREAIAAAHRATELDPLRGRAWHLLCFGYALDGQLAPARRALARAMEVNPDSQIAQRRLFELSLWEGDPRRALDELGQAQGGCRWCVAMAEHSLGNVAESQRALESLLAESPAASPYRIASVYAWRGEHDRAFVWLDRAAGQHHPDLAFVKTDPTLRNLHGDPRFGALLARMHLPAD